jgi:murein DD-endopeptidase MepM/ murein hydrolase activator NlpD
MNKKLMLWKRFRAVRFWRSRSSGSLCLSLCWCLALTACATRPLHSGKHGLLDNDSSSASSSTNHSAFVAGASPDQLYAPKEGEKLELVGKWQWPLANVKISSPYGHRGNKFHQGVDLHAPMRTPVFAASDGDVVYVGSKIRGFGQMVVIKHAGDLYSVYAHHSKNLVKLGQKVKRGEEIALSGKSGHAHGPHLHFEIRRGTQSFDPEFALNDNIRSYATRNVASEKRN